MIDWHGSIGVPLSSEDTTVVVFYISRYQGIVSTVCKEEDSEQSFGQNTSFVFDELSPKICRIIFHEYLHCSNADQLPFGRTSKKGARFICALLEQPAKRFCRLTNELELIRQVRSDKTLERNDILHAKLVERGENLNANLVVDLVHPLLLLPASKAPPKGEQGYT